MGYLRPSSSSAGEPATGVGMETSKNDPPGNLGYIVPPDMDSHRGVRLMDNIPGVVSSAGSHQRNGGQRANEVSRMHSAPAPANLGYIAPPQTSAHPADSCSGVKLMDSIPGVYSSASGSGSERERPLRCPPKQRGTGGPPVRVFNKTAPRNLGYIAAPQSSSENLDGVKLINNIPGVFPSSATGTSRINAGQQRATPANLGYIAPPQMKMMDSIPGVYSSSASGADSDGRLLTAAPTASVSPPNMGYIKPPCATEAVDQQTRPILETPQRPLTRWQQFLLATSEPFRLLREEQVRGWQSAALDAAYKAKQSEQTAATANPQDRGDAGVLQRSSFATADIEKLCYRYRNHASKILPQAHRLFFCRTSLLAGKAKRFLDLGCAPGGVSAFLAVDLGWSGIGASLPAARGGIEIAPSLLRSRGFQFVGADITTLMADTATTQGPLGQSCQFDFVNCGAVQDHGQRQAVQHERAGGTNPPLEEGDSAMDHSLQRHHPYALPWFTFLVPQLQFAFRCIVRSGAGDIMFVFGNAQCGSLPLLLSMLLPLCSGGISILETMHLTKGPVYVLLKQVRFDEAAFKHIIDLLSRDGTEEFWSLKGDEEFEVARKLFLDPAVPVRQDLETIWTRSKEYLRLRREASEREYANNEALRKRPRE